MTRNYLNIESYRRKPVSSAVRSGCRSRFCKRRVLFRGVGRVLIRHTYPELWANGGLLEGGRGKVLETIRHEHLIKHLEDEMGARPLTRRGKRVGITPAGIRSMTCLYASPQ